MERFEELTKEVFAILSDDYTLKFIPTKRLQNIDEAELFLRAMIINYHSGRNYFHFITDKRTNKVVGMIDILTPEVAKKHYKLTHYPYFIEFYLASFATGFYLMTEILPSVVDQVLASGVRKIGAVVNKQNTPAKKVLKKAKFALSIPSMLFKIFMK